jgi:prepilin-type N-terminal cleavage/methylation domain-containing protein
VRRQQSGFTLVEIAIVLVIIGLLLGGVLKGQELINSAKVKNMANDFRNIATFVYAYQDKFRAMPGDDAGVANHVTGTKAENGTQGNAKIEGDWNSSTAKDESFLFWQHVRLAGLATGTTDVVSPDYLPRNAEGGRIGVTSEAVVKDGSFPGGFFICSVMQGRYARQLDATVDDGNTSTGTMRVISKDEKNNVAAVGDLPKNLGPADDGTTYTVCMGN